MTWIYPLSTQVEAGADVIGGKAHGLIVLLRLGLPVPPGFVIGTRACREFLRDGRLPDGLERAVADLEAVTGRPLVVSVRSGGWSRRWRTCSRHGTRRAPRPTASCTASRTTSARP